MLRQQAKNITKQAGLALPTFFCYPANDLLHFVAYAGRRYFLNHAAAKSATSSKAPGSSNRCPAPGIIFSSFPAFI